MQDFRFELAVGKGKMKHLHINWLSICLQKFLDFENSRERFIEYSTVTFRFDPFAI